MDTEKEILKYIEKKENNGALFLTGKWGCGKTFLIKQIAEELNQGKKYCVAVISMFDVNSIEQLHEKIREEFFQLSLSKAGKVARATTKFLEFTNKIIDSANKHHANSKVDATTAAIGTVLSINPSDFISVSNMIGKKEFILILDDLERCNMDKTQLLGGVNEYCENKSIKTIVIADEYKIDDDKYAEFKEKVIARTIKFSYNHEEIINQMITKYEETVTGYNRFLAENRKIILSAFNNSDCQNLRTVKAVLCNFERVYDTWKSYGKGLEDMWLALYQFFALTAEYRLGNYIKYNGYDIYDIHAKVEFEPDIKEERRREYQNQANEKIKKKYVDNTFSNLYYSLSKWIVDGEWNEEDFLNELKKRYEITEIRPEESFLHCNFWSLNNESIIQGIPIATQKAYSGELSCDELLSFMQKVHFIREIDDSYVSDIDYNKIEEGLDLRLSRIRSGRLSEPQRHTFAENHTIDSEAVGINKKIENLFYKVVAWKGYDTFLCVLKDNEIRWDKLSKCNCIDVFDKELYEAFLKCFDEVDNGDKREIARVLLKVDWRNNNYSTQDEINESISNYRRLIDYLKSKTQSEDDIITKLICKEFIEKLEKMILENTSTA